MKLSKRILSLMLTTAILSGTVLTGCGQAKPSASSATASGGAQGENFQFTYMMHDKFINWLKDLKWYPELLKKTNTTVNFVSGGSNDDEYYSGVDQKIISKTFPESGIVSVSQAQVYGAQGAFVDLKPYIEKYGPNIKKYMDNNPEFTKMITSSDGAIYGIVSEAPKFADFIFYRADQFQKAGVTTVPTTVDEFTDALRALKKYYGKDNKNYYPLTGREDYIRFQSLFNAAAGFDNGVAHGIYGNGKTGTDLYSEGYKKMVEWYITLYKEGLIDPEWVSGAGTEESWESKMLTGQGSVSYDYYTRPSWFMDNGGPNNDKDYDIQIMPFLKDINGKQSVQTTEMQYNILRAMVINKTAESKAPDIIKFLDYLFSEEGQTLVSYGVEGQSYKVENNEKVYTVDYSKEEATPDGTPRWSFLNDRLTFAKPMDNQAFYKWNTKLVADAASKYFNDTYLKTSPIVTYTPEQSAELSNLSASVNPSVTAGVTEFVTGKRSITEWDKFLSEMDAKGYKKIVAIQQQAYDALYKK